MKFGFALQRLALGFIFIVIASSILLLSDWKQRRAGTGTMPRVAVLQHASTAAGINTSTAKQWRLNLIQYGDSPAAEEAEMGFVDGLREAGLTEGQEYILNRRNAHGDVATLSGIIDAARTESADMLITFSTPTLQMAIKKVRTMPIVFTFVSNAIIAGAGRSNEDHLPNVAGSVLSPPFERQMALYRELFPASTSCGTVYTPAEINSAYNYERLSEAGRKAGVEVVAVGATSSNDVADAALALASKQIDALCQISDNLTAATFTSIAKAAQRVRLPIFSINSVQAKQGASVVLSSDYHDNGRESALIAARVMRGESPAAIPFKPITATRLIINKTAAAANGLVVPESVMKRADEVIN